MNKITKKIIEAKGVRVEIRDGKKVLGRAFLYLLKNGLHKQPFGLLEDVFVEESARGMGLGTKLIQIVIKEAKKRKCYKIIATSRNSKPELVKYYAKFGLKVWGVEYRMDLL
jgi:GNAT superfamily N-acetyltransferase